MEESEQNETFVIVIADLNVAQKEIWHGDPSFLQFILFQYMSAL